MDYEQVKPKEDGFAFALESLYAYVLRLKDARKTKGKRYRPRVVCIIAEMSRYMRMPPAFQTRRQPTIWSYSIVSCLVFAFPIWQAAAVI